MGWMQIQFLAAPWGRGRRTASACLVALLAAGHLVRLALAAVNVNCPEYLLGVSRWGMFNGMLWQPFTFLFLHELQSPWPMLVTAGGFLLAGREFESVLGRRHFIGLVLTSNALGGIA